MEITSELLSIIYERAKQYAITKFNSEPDTIRLENGELIAIYDNYCCGSSEPEYETITASNLTQDLDEVAAERKKYEAIKQEEERLRRIKQEEERKRIEYNQRKQQYLKLKQEFDGDK